ncbi:hypothetical protein OPV22_002705 [Ensete ventricosum]|uniref:Uncharacterized protein n=1 Tax=Ensete ventricosum TaxID=4639 RepID=A0AAV8RYR9_ENSVE|nr:hypothetical protein OPV22_002705 [Ensete ventricosum]
MTSGTHTLDNRTLFSGGTPRCFAQFTNLFGSCFPTVSLDILQLLTFCFFLGRSRSALLDRASGVGSIDVRAISCEGWGFEKIRGIPFISLRFTIPVRNGNGNINQP